MNIGDTWIALVFECESAKELKSDLSNLDTAAFRGDLWCSFCNS